MEQNGPLHYSSKYRHEQSSLEFLINVLKLGTCMLVNTVALKSDKVASLNISISDFTLPSFIHQMWTYGFCCKIMEWFFRAGVHPGVTMWMSLLNTYANLQGSSWVADDVKRGNSARYVVVSHSYISKLGVTWPALDSTGQRHSAIDKVLLFIALDSITSHLSRNSLALSSTIRS